MRILFAAAICLTIGGCFSPKYKNGDLKCDPHDAHPCPSGYYCASTNSCWQGGAVPTTGAPDMGSSENNGDMLPTPAMDMSTPSLPSFPPAAVWISGGGGLLQRPDGTTVQVTVSGEFVVGTASTAATPSPTIRFGYFSSLTN